MKRIFRTLIFVVLMTTTPLTFTSCGDFIGMIGNLIDQIKDETDDNDEDDNFFETDDKVSSENHPTDMPGTEEKEPDNEMGWRCPEHIVVKTEGCSERYLLELCVNITSLYKYDIIGLEECDWARIEWVQDLYEDAWIPLLTVDENMTGEGREVGFEILYDNNLICSHIIIQKP